MKFRTTMQAKEKTQFHEKNSPVAVILKLKCTKSNFRFRGAHFWATRYA